MVLLIALVAVVALVFGGFYRWARSHGELARAPAPGQEQRRIPLLTEAVAYIGMILVLAGGITALGQRWNTFSATGHVAVLAGAAVFFLVAGLLLRRVPEAAIQRLVSVSWLLSVATWAAAAGYLTHDLIYAPGARGAGAVSVLVSGLAAAVYAAALWLRRPRALQDLALFGGLVTTICGIVATAALGQPARVVVLACALALWAFGLVWALLGWRRYIGPMWMTIALGALLALIAPSLAAGPYGWMYATGTVTAGAAMALSVPLRNAVLLGLGAVSAFGYVTAVVITYFHESLGVPATLSLTGALILALTVLTTRLLRRSRPGPPGGRGLPGTC